MPRRPGYFNLLTHFPWVGLRTNHPESAHLEYLRGIENPVGIKVGAGCTREQVARWLEMLDPERRPGRLTLIHRFGAGKIADALPPLIEHVRAEGGKPVWICDPMHGNTHTLANGIKTRNFEDIYSEVEQSFDIHAATGAATRRRTHRTHRRECDGVHRRLARARVRPTWRAPTRVEVDPRLNYEQSMELAFLIARKMKNGAH